MGKRGAALRTFVYPEIGGCLIRLGKSALPTL